MNDLFPWDEIYRQTLVLDHISVAEKMLRPIVVYLCLVAGLRIAGKRELAQMNPLDLIVLLTLSNTVQNAIIGADNTITGGLIGAATLLAVNFVLVRFAFRHRWFDRIVNGDELPLIRDGKVLRENLDRLLISEPELRAVARHQGVRRLSDIETATLETSGTISVFAKQSTPETALLKRMDERLAPIEAILTKPAAEPGR